MHQIETSFLPKSLITRYLDLPETPDEAIKICEVCGETCQVKPLTFGGALRYAPAPCPCKIAEKERQEQEQIRAAMLEVAACQTYSWLGRDRRWSDLALRQKTFATFDASKQQDAFDAAQLFARDPYGTLVLHGTYGTGKTHILAALCNAALQNKKPIKSLFTTSPKLFAAIQERIGRGEEYYGLIEKAIETPLLVIDDIDKAKWSEFREEIYFSIIDERVKASKPIAISTNRLDELASFVGGAVCSRLKMGQVAIEMSGEDYREVV